MISLSAATLFIVRQTRKLVRTVVIHEMRKSAAGYGLYNDNLFPDRKSEPTINLHFTKRRPRIPKH